MSDDRSYGEIHWDAYIAAHPCGGDLKLSDLDDDARGAVEAGAEAVARAAIARRIDELDAQTAPYERYALVEQMGHRATTGTVRETTFLGERMLEVTDLLNGSVHLVSPKSLYEVSWLTEEQARQQVKPWTAVALPSADPWRGDDEDDEYRQAGIDATPEMHDHGGKERDYDAEGNEL